jgi:hypothetical protein
MITEQEKNEIINAAVERVLAMIPEVMGNLMANHAALHKINSAFYQKHPNFAKHKNVVQSVVEMIEGKNPLLEYEKILEQAVPDIQRRIEISKDVNVTSVVDTISRDYNGVL